MKRVLIVDDEKDFAENVVKVFLEQTGRFLVKVESLGVKAVNSAKAFHPDLVFLDVMMRDCAGPKVAADLQAEPEFAKLPIVFLTATSTRSKEQAGLFDGQMNGRPFIAKPLKLDQLVECIDSILET